jgi:protein gp37
MAERSTIEWTEATWNPVTGCTKVSPGCAHCYAETFAERFRGVPGHPYERGFDLQLRPERLDQPLTWKRPRMIFVNSMSDLFHERSVPGNGAGELAPRLPWPANVWMGVSVENQRWTCRIDALRRTPAAVRFLSCEPLLAALQLNLEGIHWVIVGGESGPGARPMKPAWARDIRRQCEDCDVPFFFKQWGAYSEEGMRVGKGKAGRVLDGQKWNALPLRFRAASVP